MLFHSRVYQEQGDGHLLKLHSSFASASHWALEHHCSIMSPCCKLVRKVAYLFHVQQEQTTLTAVKYSNSTSFSKTICSVHS